MAEKNQFLFLEAEKNGLEGLIYLLIQNLEWLRLLILKIVNY